MRISVKDLASAAVVGAAYAALTMLLAPISFGLVQFRASEALCILPAFLPAASWGLWVGCALVNFMSGYGIPDIVFGSFATLMASLCIARIARGRSPLLGWGPLPGRLRHARALERAHRRRRHRLSTGAFWAAFPLNARRSPLRKRR